MRPPPISPQREALEALVQDLPLRIEGLTDEPEFYMALLRVRERWRSCLAHAAVRPCRARACACKLLGHMAAAELHATPIFLIPGRLAAC